MLRRWSAGAVVLVCWLGSGCVRPPSSLADEDTSSSGGVETGGAETGEPSVCPDGTLWLNWLGRQAAVDAAAGCERTIGGLGIGACVFAPTGTDCDPEDPVTSVTALSALKEVAGDLRMSSAGEWTSLEGLEGLRFVGGDLILGFNPVIAENFDSLAPLSGLEHARGLEIYSSTTLTDLDELSALDTQALERVSFEDLRVMTNVEALAGIRQASVDFYRMDALESLDGLESLEGPSVLVEASAIVDASGLAGLQGDLQSLSIAFCPNLVSLTISDEITRADVMYIEGLPKLETVDGGAGLVELGYLEIADLAALTTPLEFPAVEYVDRVFVRFGNVADIRFPVAASAGSLDLGDEGVEHLEFPALIDVEEDFGVGGTALTFADFGALTHVGGDFTIWGTALTDLGGFGALNQVDGNLTITGNQMLPTALAQAFADGIDVGGKIEISDNAP